MAPKKLGKPLAGDLSFIQLINNFDIKSRQKAIIEYHPLLSKNYPSLNEKVASFLDFAEKHFSILKSPQKSNEFSKLCREVGNKYLISSKNNREALNYYNMAISQAENSSTELSIAYANRSAINFNFGRYEDTIIDIERALAGQYPENLKFKILLRKAKCLVHLKNYTAATTAYKVALESIEASDVKKPDLVDSIKSEMGNIRNKKDATRDNYEGPELTDPPSDTIYCASAAVQVTSSPSMGRMIIAAKDIQPGNVLALEKAYASDIMEKHFSEFCYECKKRCHSMIPCLKCTQVFYCDENCRSRSWDTEHMIECNIMPTLNNLQYVIALKVLLKMTKQGRKLQNFIDKQEKYFGSNTPFGGFKHQKYSANNTSMMNLCFDQDYLHLKAIEVIILCSCIFVLALKTTDFFDFMERGPIDVAVVRILMKIICQANCNRFALQINSDPYGEALFPFMSLINHSCDPNALATGFEKDSFLLVAVEPIKKGQEISISYDADFFMNEEQRKMCFKSCGFKCLCRGCQENWSIVEEMPKQIVFTRGISCSCIDDVMCQFAFLESFYYNQVKGVPGGKALLKQAHLDSLFKVMAFLSERVTKPEQTLYACKFLIIDFICDLIDTNSLRLAK